MIEDQWRARAGVWLIAAGITSTAWAQIGAGALAGDVVDQAGAVAPGATVTVTAVGSGVSRTSVTGREGSFGFQGLAPGMYELKVELSGFRPYRRNHPTRSSA
jgi:hypothetical protein